MATKKQSSPIADRMKEARKDVRMTQQALADASGVSRETIAKIETGEITRPREIVALSEALKVSPSWLQFGPEQTNNLSPDVLDAAFALEALPAVHQVALIQIIRALREATKRSSND
jgi:transcriptional regulator with XRE-family HTH domain